MDRWWEKGKQNQRRKKKYEKFEENKRKNIFNKKFYNKLSHKSCSTVFGSPPLTGNEDESKKKLESELSSLNNLNVWFNSWIQFIKLIFITRLI